MRASPLSEATTFFDHGELFGADVARLVDDHHISKLDLLNQQSNKAAIIAFASGFAAIPQRRSVEA